MSARPRAIASIRGVEPFGSRAFTLAPRRRWSSTEAGVPEVTAIRNRPERVGVPPSAMPQEASWSGRAVTAFRAIAAADDLRVQTERPQPRSRAPLLELLTHT